MKAELMSMLMAIAFAKDKGGEATTEGADA